MWFWRCKTGNPKDQGRESGNKTDDDYEDLTDSDEAENFDFVSKPERAVQRLSKGSNSKRKKYGGLKLLDKHTGRNKFWRLRGKLQVSRYPSETDCCSLPKDGKGCICTSLKTDGGDNLKLEGAVGGTVQKKAQEASFPLSVLANLVPPSSQAKENKNNKGKGAVEKKAAPIPNRLPLYNLNKLYPVNDIDQQRMLNRRREMELGVEVTDRDLDVWIHKSEAGGENKVTEKVEAICAVVPSRNSQSMGQYPSYGAMGLLSPQADVPCSSVRLSSVEDLFRSSTSSLGNSPWLPTLTRPLGVHTQVDYKHYLVPNLDDIVSSSFYWGVMDRYEAERLIDKKPEGTFLLRDSAQDDFLFSVSFRRYGRSLHARIEQWNHSFSFDSRDPGVFAADSVCGLIEHYKDPTSCMFFEPMLTQPLHRTFPFSLQHLARAKICSNITYDGICQLTLPRSLKDYLRCYHYKQKVRVRIFETAS